MDCILSVKAEFAERIAAYEKLYEFRRTRIACDGWVWIYQSGGEKRIVGKFPYKPPIAGTPQEIWNECGWAGGIDEKRFHEYFQGSPIAYAYPVEFYVPHERDPYTEYKGFRPPQSFMYIR